MKKLKKNKLLLIIFSLILVTLPFIKTGLFTSAKADTKTNVTESAVKKISFNTPSDEAPGINNETGRWINTDKNITMEDLKGKVVLIEFWTFGCYNCRNTLPYLEKWYDKYKSDNFEMIGVHCPEFDNERNFENVKSSVNELGIKYPVLTDNEFSVWEKYDVHAWPTIFLIDKNGTIRYSRIGEGKYDKTEEVINELLGENYSSGKNN